MRLDQPVLLYGAGREARSTRAFIRAQSPATKVYVTVDSGTTAAWYARDLKFRRGMMGSVSGGLASMGCAIPYALAARLAHPRRPVVAIAGDGAMQMLGNSGLVSIAARWQRWADHAST